MEPYTFIGGQSHHLLDSMWLLCPSLFCQTTSIGCSQQCHHDHSCSPNDSYFVSIISNLHITSPTSSKKVVVLNNLLNIELNINLWPFPPSQKLKMSYDNTQFFLFEWTMKLPWVESVFFTYCIFHNVRCKICNTIEKKPCLLAPKWDTLKVGIKYRRICQSFKSRKKNGTTLQDLLT